MVPVPEGEYLVSIVSSDEKQTKNKEGKFLELVLQIIDGEHKGRKLWDRLNLWNKSQQAQQIASGTLSAICRAVSVPEPQDSSQLHDKPLIAVVKCRKYNDSITNEVKGYKPHGGDSYSEPAPQAQQPAAAAPQQPTIGNASSKAPW